MKIKIVLGLMVLLIPVSVKGQMKWSQQFQQYFDQYKDMAIDQMRRYHIPASITLAQGVLESGAGRSELAVKGNNHFGIKCHGWTGRAVYHDDDENNECFRAYSNASESFEDHSKFLSTSSRYSSLFQLKQTDYKGWAYGLKSCGYATNPRYAIQLIDIIQLYKLYELDDAKSYSKSKNPILPLVVRCFPIVFMSLTRTTMSSQRLVILSVPSVRKSASLTKNLQSTMRTSVMLF